MRNLLTVLKKLGKKMTGQDITGKNLVTVVDDIAEKYTGGSGGEGGGSCDCTFVMGSTFDEATMTDTLDKTWQEIYDALAAGKRVISLSEYIEDGITSVYVNEFSSADNHDSGYNVSTITKQTYIANTPSGYPQCTQPIG